MQPSEHPWQASASERDIWAHTCPFRQNDSTLNEVQRCPLLPSEVVSQFTTPPPFFGVLSWLCIGPIPVEICQLQALKVLWLNDSKLTAQYSFFLPYQTSALPLTAFGSGEPVHHPPFFVVLSWLCIGPIPVEICQLQALKELDLSWNQLTGQYFFFLPYQTSALPLAAFGVVNQFTTPLFSRF